MDVITQEGAAPAPVIPQMTNCFSAGRRAPKGSPVSGVRRAHVVQRAIQAVLGLSGPAVWSGCPAPADRRACGAMPGRKEIRGPWVPRESVEFQALWARKATAVRLVRRVIPVRPAPWVRKGNRVIPEPAVRLVNKVLWENRVYRVKPAHRVLRESAAAPVLWGSRDQWDQPALPEKSAPPAPKG